MIIIASLGASVKDYLALYDENSPDFRYECPICGSCKPHRHGHFERWAVDSDLEVRIPIYRYQCVTNKNKTISLLPSFLWPFRTLLSAFIEKAICLRVDDHLSWGELVIILNSRPGLVSEKTLIRWVKVLANIFQEVTTKLLSLLLKYFRNLAIPPAALTSDRVINLSIALSLGRFLRGALVSNVPGLTHLNALPVFSVLHSIFGVNLALTSHKVCPYHL